MIKLLVTTALAIAGCYSYAQKIPDSLSASTMFLRFNPLGFADVTDMNISVGAEKRLTKKSSVALDVSFVFYSPHFRDQSQRERGYILRPAYRFFPGKGYFFVEAEGHYKQVNHRITDWVGRGAVDDVPTYEEFTTIRLRKSVIGGHIKVGRQYLLSPRIWMEIYLGLGVHFRKYRVVEDPRMTYIIDDTFFPISTLEDDVMPAVPAGIRFLYRFSK